MSEQPNGSHEGTQDDGSHASVGGEVDQPGGGRTAGETAADEALGGADE